MIILQNLIKAYHRKSGKSKYDGKLAELDVETTRIRSRVYGVLEYTQSEVTAFRSVIMAELNHMFFFAYLGAFAYEGLVFLEFILRTKLRSASKVSLFKKFNTLVY